MFDFIRCGIYGLVSFLLFSCNSKNSEVVKVFRVNAGAPNVDFQLKSDDVRAHQLVIRKSRPWSDQEELNIAVYLENTGGVVFQTNDFIKKELSEPLRRGDKVKIYEGRVNQLIAIPLVNSVRGGEFSSRITVESNLAELEQGEVLFEILKFVNVPL